MSRRSIASVVGFPLALALAVAVGPARGADDAAAKAELAGMQGRWEREAAQDAPYRRASKEINGDKETITFYDADGKVIYQHRVDFKLSKIGELNVFTYSNLQVLDGPNKGQKSPGSASYLYRVRGDKFIEVTGLLPGEGEEEPAVTVWTKAKGAAAPAPKGDALDARALAGTWQAVTSTRGGEDRPEDETRRHRLVFDGDKFKILRDGETMIAGTFKLNGHETPAQIDMTIQESPDNPDNQGKVVLGIIELTGDDLKWCTCGPRSSERPTKFASEADSRDMLVVLKREKK